MPVWNDNEFLRPDGFRPVIRTLTPHRFEPVARTLDVEVVVHSGGPVALANRHQHRARLLGGRGLA
jgi:NADPH-dependent ferric siderophore reductase